MQEEEFLKIAKIKPSFGQKSPITFFRSCIRLIFENRSMGPIEGHNLKMWVKGTNNHAVEL